MSVLTQDELTKVEAVFTKYNIPKFVWLPILTQESGGNPNSHATVGEDSRGLFQINVAAHPEYASKNLYDPVTNAEIAAKDFIAPSYNKAVSQGITNPGELSAYVWKNGIRPNWTLVVANHRDIQLKSLADTVAVTGQYTKNFMAGTPNAPVVPITSELAGDKSGVADSGGGGIFAPIVKALDALNPITALDKTFAKVATGFIEVVWVLIGLGILFMGIYIAFKPQIDSAMQEAGKAAAMVAAPEVAAVA